MNWNKECRYKIYGRLANSERGLVLVFDLASAVMFDPLPEEYFDKHTGKMKKRIVKYYPDEIRMKLGRSYKSYSYISSWREADREQWNQARWFNGMDAAQTADENKTIVCGHWHTSYGHSKYEHKGTEFGEDADFSPYYGPGIIAIDACTAFSGKVNCLVIED